MHCQIVHDSLHIRAGWTEPYMIDVDGVPAAYGSVLVGGLWAGSRMIFEFHAFPAYELRVFDLFNVLVEASRPTGIRCQTNDTLLTVMLHTYARDVLTEKIVFEDHASTTLSVDGAVLRHRAEPDSDWALVLDGVVAATGGILYHYNRPYGDIYMEVAEGFRRRGLGSFLVQELKRICRHGGSIPCARCSPDNAASQRTLQKAGFWPCASILEGSLSPSR